LGQGGADSAGGGWWKERQDLSQTQREAVIKDALRRFNEQETIQGARTGPVSFVVVGDYRSVLLAPRFEGFNGHGGYVLSFDCHKGHEDRVFDYLCGVIDAALLDFLPGAGRDGQAWAPKPILAIYNPDSGATGAGVLEVRLRPLVGEFLEAHAEFKECSVSVKAVGKDGAVFWGAFLSDASALKFRRLFGDFLESRKDTIWRR
jgi:hypothetical protein